MRCFVLLREAVEDGEQVTLFCPSPTTSKARAVGSSETGSARAVILAPVGIEPLPNAVGHRHRIGDGTRYASLEVLMADAPPPDPPPGPPPAPQVPAEAILPDTEDAKRLFLTAEALRQRARELSEEVTQKLQHLDIPTKPENES
jgi:hypothetical protein